MGKSEEFFPNAAVWDPHRWEGIADPAEQEKEKMDYGYGLVSTGADSTYLPFGAGRHRCIGEQFAYVQLTIIVIMMVREFRLKDIGGKKDVVATDYSVGDGYPPCCCSCAEILAVSLCFRDQWSRHLWSGNGGQMRLELTGWRTHYIERWMNGSGEGSPPC